MKSINVAILEDNKNEAVIIEERICKAFEKINCRVVFTFFADSYHKFIDRLASNPVDVCFMDIDIGDNKFDGMDAAQEVQNKKPGARIVFVTGKKGVMRKAFQFNALDFIEKPYKQTDIDSVAKRIKDHFDTGDNYLEIDGRIKQRIPYKDIILVRLCGRRVTVVTHTKIELLPMSYTMSKITSLLPKEEFVECNSGLCLRIDKIRKFDGKCIELNIKIKDIGVGDLQVSSFCAKRLNKLIVNKEVKNDIYVV